MAPLKTNHTNDLANQFLAMAQAVGDFRYRHWKELSAAQHRKLALQHLTILNYGEDMLVLSAGQIPEDVADAIATIKKVSVQMTAAMNKLDDIRKGIGLATSIVKLGTAILSQQPATIGKAADEFVKKFKSLAATK